MKVATISFLTILMNILNTALAVMAHQKLDLLIPECLTNSFSCKMAAGKGAFGAMLTPALAADESKDSKVAEAGKSRGTDDEQHGKADDGHLWLCGAAAL